MLVVVGRWQKMENFVSLGCLSGHFSEEKFSVTSLVFLGSVPAFVLDEHKESGGSSAARWHMLVVSGAISSSLELVPGRQGSKCCQMLAGGSLAMMSVQHNGWELGPSQFKAASSRSHWEDAVWRAQSAGPLWAGLLLCSEIKGNKMTEDDIEGFPVMLLSLASSRETHGKRQ